MVVASSVRQVSADLVAITLVPGVEMEFVRIPAGEFLMGSDKSKDRDADPDELPQHILNLQEYWMSKGPVTATHFAPFGKPTGWRNPTIAEGENKANHPVVNVTWDDCTAFCFWAAKLTGFEIALASEAEWEKAARGPDGRLYPWGDEPPDATRLNYNHLVDTTTEQGKYGQRGRSPYGCDDMAGNVWEWTRSLWGKDGSKPEFGYPYTNRQTEREDLTAGRDVLRVLRGGSFNDDARDVQCASRFRLGPDSTSAASVFG